MNFWIGLVIGLLYLFGWIAVLMSEEKSKQEQLGFTMIATAMFLLGGIAILEGNGWVKLN